ncbi:MAG: hypothetical protein J1F11_10835 [Oscillospiraceae bacterium]|nr:hypothetical protein [Oscillospiraceae bacterium]
MAKRKFAVMIALAVMLSSCGQADSTADISVTVPVSETAAVAEISSDAVQETGSDVTGSGTETAEKAETGRSKEIKYINDDIVTVIDIETLSKEYTGNIKGSENYYYAVHYCGGDNVLIHFKGTECDYGYVIDVSNGSLEFCVNEISEYDGIEYANSLVRSGRYFYYFGKMENDILSDTEVIEIFGSYYNVVDEVPVQKCGRHWLHYNDEGIIDMSSEEVLVYNYLPDRDEKGNPQEDSKQNIQYFVLYAVDENRFLYYGVCGELITGYGIYDFETKTSYEIPDSDNLVFLGAAGEKIFFYPDEMYSTEEKIYCSDISALNNIVIRDITEELFDNYKITAPFCPIKENRQLITADMDTENGNKTVIFDLENEAILLVLPDNFPGDKHFTDCYIYSVSYDESKIYVIPRDTCDMMIDMTKFADEDSLFRWAQSCGNDIICASYSRGNDEQKEVYFVIIDLAEEKVIDKIEAENAVSSGMYFKYKKKYVELSGEDFCNVYKINPDGSYELTDLDDILDTPDMCGSHTIIRDVNNLVDKESGKILVYPVGDRSGRFIGAIDDNRFLYEGTRSFGIYDFASESITYLNERGWVPMAASENKIIFHSVDSEWGLTVESVDISNMDSRSGRYLFNDSTYPTVYSEYAIDIPDDIECIGASVYDRDGRKYLIIDTDSGEEAELPYIFARHGAFFTDSFICTAADNYLYMIKRDELFNNYGR